MCLCQRQLRLHGIKPHRVHRVCRIPSPPSHLTLCLSVCLSLSLSLCMCVCVCSVRPLNRPCSEGMLDDCSCPLLMSLPHAFPSFWTYYVRRQANRPPVNRPRVRSPPAFGHPGQTPPDEMPYAVKSPLGQKPPPCSKCFLSI